MSEDRPVYIPCASGNQLMTDFVMQTRGSLIEIVGHPIMQLTPQDALWAARMLKAMADAIIDHRMVQNADLGAS